MRTNASEVRSYRRFANLVTAGLIAIAALITAYQILKVLLVARGVATEAEVVSVEFHETFSTKNKDYYLTTYRYDVDGAYFTSSMQGASAPYAVGDRLKVSYDPKSPERVVPEAEAFDAPITVAITWLAFAPFLAVTAWMRRKASNWERILERGVRIQADVADVLRSGNAGGSGAWSWNVSAEWTDAATGKKRRAYSPFRIDADPKPKLAAGKIDVLVDPADPKKVLMDTEHLLN